MKKTKITKTKAKTLTQRIEALKALKVRRQKLTKRIEKIEAKLLNEVESVKDQVTEEPQEIELDVSESNDTWELIEGCSCIRCTGARLLRDRKDGVISFLRFIK